MRTHTRRLRGVLSALALCGLGTGIAGVGTSLQDWGPNATGGVPVRVSIDPVVVDAGEDTDIDIALRDWTAVSTVALQYQAPAGVEVTDVVVPVYSITATTANPSFTLATVAGYQGTVSIKVRAIYKGKSGTGDLGVN